MPGIIICIRNYSAIFPEINSENGRVELRMIMFSALQTMAPQKSIPLPIGNENNEMNIFLKALMNG